MTYHNGYDCIGNMIKIYKSLTEKYEKESGKNKKIYINNEIVCFRVCFGEAVNHLVALKFPKKDIQYLDSFLAITLLDFLVEEDNPSMSGVIDFLTYKKIANKYILTWDNLVFNKPD